MASISSREWVAISRSLQDHHALFHQCWQMGKPCFTNDIQTAGVRFNKKTGNYLDFLFNPTFWESLTPYMRIFVIAHECLHVILNHGLRTRDAKDDTITNWALDIVVNHMLVRSFGFDRTQIQDWENLCWVDTVFADHPDLANIPMDGAFEYYLNLIPARKILHVHLLDDHGSLPDNWHEVVGNINNKLNPDEQDTLKGIIDKHAQGEKGIWSLISPGSVKKNKKWETIIDNWSKMYLRTVDRHKEQWLRVNRRLWSVQGNLLLPSEQEETNVVADRINVYFFLDTSGSCWRLRERFFRAAMSLPEDRFDIRLFCFDTSVEETDLGSAKIYGGGSTFFHIIEEEIQKRMTSEQADYPGAVFIITDGDGTSVKPAMPKRWHWFLTHNGTSRCIPHECKKYDLADFE